MPVMSHTFPSLEVFLLFTLYQLIKLIIKVRRRLNDAGVAGFRLIASRKQEVAQFSAKLMVFPRRMDNVVMCPLRGQTVTLQFFISTHTVKTS